jgi:mannose-1-phosphate guanylyltransferase/mannose-6-phosphate isomerase
VTNEIHQYLARNQIEELGYTISDDHLLAEPEGRNTLPAIAWAMQRIRGIFSSATVVVFPSDHILGDSALDQIRAAEPLSRKNLVTFGIKPTSPNSGYGYIKPGKPLSLGFMVDEFKEKPDEKTAKEYVRKGYLWNSGIFLLSTDSFFQELKKYCPDLFKTFYGGHVPDYKNLDSISIDYGLLEHSKKVAVVALDTKWSDLGTFKALYDSSFMIVRGMWVTLSIFQQEIILCIRRENM